MASVDDWIVETVTDFIHSRIWIAPIQTFIEENCLAFEYEEEIDEDDDEEVQYKNSIDKKQDEETLEKEQAKIFRQYQQLVESLITGLGHDLNLNQDELHKACILPKSNSGALMMDEPFEQLYSAQDFQMFQEMMRRKNLILQLQALVSLQLQWGLLSSNETGEDLVLSLLLEATKVSSRDNDSENAEEESHPKTVPMIPRYSSEKTRTDQGRSIQTEHDDDDDVEFVAVKRSDETKQKVKSQTPVKQEYRLPDLRRKPDLDNDWHRKLRVNEDQEKNEQNSLKANESENLSNRQTISNIPEDLLREKLRELTIRNSANDSNNAAAINSRNEFLRQQRDLLLKKQRAERKQDIEEETRNARPQSAAYAARKALTTTGKSNTIEKEKEPQISSEELAKRQALANKLRRQVVDKR